MTLTKRVFGASQSLKYGQCHRNSGSIVRVETLENDGTHFGQMHLQQGGRQFPQNHCDRPHLSGIQLNRLDEQVLQHQVEELLFVEETDIWQVDCDWLREQLKGDCSTPGQRGILQVGDQLQ